jgi:hypothetical protein
MAMPSHTAYELVAATFALNLPFGAYRTTVRRLSWQWFLAIHLPIPAIFLLRTAAGYSYLFIPWLFLAAVAGQLAGGRAMQWWRTRRAAGLPTHACATANAGAGLQSAEDDVARLDGRVADDEGRLQHAAAGLAPPHVAGVDGTQLLAGDDDVADADA